MANNTRDLFDKSLRFYHRLAEMKLNEIDLDIPPPRDLEAAYYQYLISVHFKKKREGAGLLSFTIGFFIGLLIAITLVG